MNSSIAFQRTKKPFFFLKNRWIGKICYTPSLERPSELSRPIVFQNLATDLKDECIYFVIISTHMDLLPYLQPDPECWNPGWKNCRSKLHCSGAPWCRHLWKEGKDAVLGATVPFCNSEESLSSASCQMLLWCDGLRWQRTWCGGSSGPFPSYTLMQSSSSSFVTDIVAE